MEPPLAEPRDHGAEQAGLAGDRIHRDRAESGREKRTLSGGKHRLRLAARIIPGKRIPRGVHAGSLV
jgi:hypothetical protein